MKNFCLTRKSICFHGVLTNSHPIFHLILRVQKKCRFLAQYILWWSVFVDQHRYYHTTQTTKSLYLTIGNLNKSMFHSASLILLHAITTIVSGTTYCNEAHICASTTINDTELHCRGFQSCFDSYASHNVVV